MFGLWSSGLGFMFRSMGEGFGGTVPRHFRRLRESLGLRFGVWVWVLKLGFGVYISEFGFRCFVSWESGINVLGLQCEGLCLWR